MWVPQLLAHLWRVATSSWHARWEEVSHISTFMAPCCLFMYQTNRMNTQQAVEGSVCFFKNRGYSCVSFSWSIRQTNAIGFCLLTLCRLMSYIYIYMSYHTADLQTLHFKYLFNKYPYWIFWTCCVISVFLSSKYRLFHNATLFGSCIIHILNTGCGKI
jgi:hypothetical protein